MHYYFIEDCHGELVALVPFCSDSCHRQWCNDNGVEYLGWNGAHENGDSAEYCHCCGVIAGASEECCEHQTDNVVVNRFPSTAGEKCDCGNWIQLPESIVAKL